MNLLTKTVAAVAALVGAFLLLPALAAAASGPIAIPAIPGVSPLPGLVASPATPAANMGVLKVSPDTAVPGQKFSISGSGLPANKPVTLTWSTANVTWLLDPRPDSVDYLGRQTTKFPVVLAQTTTDSNGAFAAVLTVPKDWGGIHDIYAVVDGVQYAKGGLLSARWARITPKSGPIGTPITVTYGGLGSSLYEGGGALLWDSKFAGVMTSVWTRGVAVAHIRAAGPVGKHVLTLRNSLSAGYLNVPQSPLPWTTEFNLTFTVTKDAGAPKQRLDWPSVVAPTLDQRTTMSVLGGASSSSATATLSSTAGTVNSKVSISATGLTAGAVSMEWATVVGNRVNCTGTCWTTSNIPLGSATANADGTLSSSITIPDGLGGWHAVQLIQNGKVVAQVPYYIKRSFASDQGRIVVKQGKEFTIHLKGLGWTQLDNTVAIDYDNSYVGYGCGFNSNGDVVIHLVATGGPGTHIIDGYPLLYTQQPAYANTQYGMIPFLAYAQDEPGLALGYQLPAIRLAITVVK